MRAHGQAPFHLAESAIADSLTKPHDRRLAGATEVADFPRIHVEELRRVQHNKMSDARMIFRERRKKRSQIKETRRSTRLPSER